MLIISGNSGNYISFKDRADLLGFIDNLKYMMERKEEPLVFGFTSDETPSARFDEEYKFIKEMISNDLVMRARAGG